MSEGNNAKCPLKYRTVPHIKALVSQMLMVEKHWTKRQNKGSGIIFCIYYGIRGGRGEGLLWACSTCENKSSWKARVVFFCLAFCWNALHWFCKATTFPKLNDPCWLEYTYWRGQGFSSPWRRSPPSSPAEWWKPQEKNISIFFFSFQQTAKLRRGQL